MEGWIAYQCIVQSANIGLTSNGGLILLSPLFAPKLCETNQPIDVVCCITCSLLPCLLPSRLAVCADSAPGAGVPRLWAALPRPAPAPPAAPPPFVLFAIMMTVCKQALPSEALPSNRRRCLQQGCSVRGRCATAAKAVATPAVGLIETSLAQAGRCLPAAVRHRPSGLNEDWQCKRAS